MATEKLVRTLALALPETTEKPCFGTPGFYVKGKLFARLWEDGATLVVMVPTEDRAELIAAEPEKFFFTDHYANYPSVLVRLPAIDRAELREVLTDSWRFRAPKRVLAAFDAANA
jgi:hypothetical protein